MGANSGCTDWWTPRVLGYFYRDVYGLRCDAAASPANALCPDYITESDDALSMPWPAGRGPYWCNPPYARGTLLRWAIHASLQVEAGATVVFLAPAWTEQEWFIACLLPLASELHYLRQRVPFLLDGEVRDSGRFPSIVLVLRPPHERHPLTVKSMSWKNNDVLRLVPVNPGWPVIERSAAELLEAA